MIRQYVYIIDQVRGQDGWILAELSFCVFMDRDEVMTSGDSRTFLTPKNSRYHNKLDNP